MVLAQAGLIQLLKLETQTQEGGLALVPTSDHTNAFGTVHLAVLTALAEGAAWLAMGENAVPTEVNSNFFRPAKVGSRLTTEVTVVNKGKSLGLADANVYQDGKHIAAFRISFFFPPEAK